MHNEGERNNETNQEEEEEELTFHNSIEPESYFYWIVASGFSAGLVIIVMFLSIGDGPLVPIITEWAAGDLSVYPAVEPIPERFNRIPDGIHIHEGYRYELFLILLSYDDAVALCEARQARMLNVESEGEQTAIKNWVSGPNVFIWLDAKVKVVGNETEIHSSSQYKKMCPEWESSKEKVAALLEEVDASDAVLMNFKNATASKNNGCWTPLVLVPKNVAWQVVCKRENIDYHVWSTYT